METLTKILHKEQFLTILFLCDSTPQVNTIVVVNTMNPCLYHGSISILKAKADIQLSSAI